MTSVISNFENIYHLQDAGKFFLNATSFLSAMNKEFPNLLEESIEDELLSLGYSKKIIDELVKTTLVVNYGQGTNVHSFVGFVSFAGAGFDLWSVKGGNKKVVPRIVSWVNYLNCTVNDTLLL